MMNVAVSGGQIPSGAREEVAYLQATEREAQAVRDYQVLFKAVTSCKIVKESKIFHFFNLLLHRLFFIRHFSASYYFRRKKVHP